MAKQAKARRLTGAEAMSKVRTLRTSPRKLNLVAQSIRGLKVQRALNELEFSPKRIARDVRITQIYEGANDIQRLVIGRAIAA